MAQNVKDSFLDLERHRQMLEDNIEKLRKSLHHWQTWEIEYEGLKEEILAADPTPDRQQLVSLARDYEGELVDRKEVEEILGPEARDAAQVVNLLDRRIEYVEQNIRTIEKQLETTENRLTAATIISKPDVRNEEGLPLTEIMEELDEDGNVISSHTSTPGSSKPQLLEVLKKAGVGVPSSSVPSGSASKPTLEAPAIPTNKAAEAKIEPATAVAKPAKKGVNFTEDTKTGPELEKSQTARRLEEIMNMAKRSEARPSEPPTIPTNESAEDAALRRDMLRYGLSEVDSVVAELSLEDASDWSEEDYEDGENDTDDEDEFGRSRGSVVDDDLRQRMIELEERLGVRMMENVGNKASDYDIVDEGIGRVAINGQHNDPTQEDSQVTSKRVKNGIGSSTPITTSTKKSVRFSEDIDVSPAPQAKAAPPPAKKVLSAPISDIVERAVPKETGAPVPRKMASRFKSDRSPGVSNGIPTAIIPSSSSAPASTKSSQPEPSSRYLQFAPAQEQPRIVPSGPEGKTLASTIMERDVPPGAATEPNELDPHLLHQEVATEYHRVRNKMIHQQGGFMKEDESEIIPFTEEEGGPKKLSRFKAARLARS